MNLGLIGNYGATNVGDDAILTALLKKLSGHNVTVFSADPEQTKSQFGVKTAPLFPLGVRSFFRGRFYPSLKALKDLDAVVLGGGGLFQDDKLYACFLWAWQIFWVKYFKKPLFVYATGVGPLKSKLAKRLTLFAYSHAKLVTVRDAFSYNLLVKIGLPKHKIHTTADPTFSYRVIEKKTPKKQNIFISLRPWLHFDPDVIDTVSRTLEKYSQENEVDYVFVAMQNIKEADQKLIKPLQQRVGGRLLIPRHFSELLHHMQDCELAIGMRFHFLIAAMLTKTPCLPISYSPKVDALFKETPLWPHLIPIKSLSSNRLLEGLKEIVMNSGQITQHLGARVHYLKAQMKKNDSLFDEFIKKVDQGRAR